MTSYDPAARRHPQPPPPQRATGTLVLALEDDPTHLVYLDASDDDPGGPGRLVETWRDAGGELHQVVHPVPWDMATDPPVTVGTIDWRCSACGTATTEDSDQQLAAFIASHPCSSARPAHGGLRLVPPPTDTTTT